MSSLSEETIEKIIGDTMGQENERALDEAYQDGYDAGMQDKDAMDEAYQNGEEQGRKYGYDEGYQNGLSDALAAIERLQ